MKGFLARNVDRQLRRMTLGTMVGVAIITTSAVATGRTREPTFDQVEMAVQKAQTLLSSGVCDSRDTRTSAACAKLMKKANDLLAKAADAISAAAVAADGGDVDLKR
jgi:hypothetical protein